MPTGKFKKQNDIKTKALQIFRKTHKVYWYSQHRKPTYNFKARPSELCPDCKKMVVFDYRFDGKEYKICPSCKTETLTD